jgi:hypothetical protein
MQRFWPKYRNFYPDEFRELIDRLMASTSSTTHTDVGSEGTPSAD